MKLSTISSLLGAQLIGADTEFKQISLDTRTLNPGDLFVALSGEQFDGHNFIAAAQAKGAVAAIVSQKSDVAIPQLQVADTRIALGKLAEQHRQQFNVPLIALTGSCGKTTTKEMLRAILSVCGPTLASLGTLNNDIGVPLTLLRLTSEHQYAVIEMGANHPHEIRYLSQLAHPDVAFITNVAPGHLAGFGSIEGVMKAKSEIFENLTPQGTAIINADDFFAEQWRQLLKDRKLVSFGVRHPADFSVRDISNDHESCFSFVLVTPKGDVVIKLPLPGQHNVLNALAAAAAAQAVGAPLEAIKAGLESMNPVPGRLVVRAGQIGSHIIDDTYNANPASMEAALKVLAQRTGERVFVMGDMAELGETSPEHHQRVGELAKKLGINQLYACGNLSRLSVEAFGQGGFHFANQEELSEALRAILQPEMTLLVKGSRSSKMENIVKALVV